MKRIAVVVANTWAVVWLGDVENALQACRNAVREANEPVYDVRPASVSSQAVDDLEVLTMSAYDVSALGDVTLDILQANQDLLAEHLHLGSYEARYY